MPEIAVYGFGKNYDLIDWTDSNLVPKLDDDGNTVPVDKGIHASKMVIYTPAGDPLVEVNDD